MASPRLFTQNKVDEENPSFNQEKRQKRNQHLKELRDSSMKLSTLLNISTHFPRTSSSSSSSSVLVDITSEGMRELSISNKY